MTASSTQSTTSSTINGTIAADAQNVTAPRLSREEKVRLKAQARAKREAARAEKVAARQAELIFKEKVKLVYRARKERLTHPEGSFNRQGIWYPSKREDQNHLASIRAPSAMWPYGYQRACRTRKHVTALALHSPDYFDELLAEAEEDVVAWFGQKARTAYIDANPEYALKLLMGEVK